MPLNSPWGLSRPANPIWNPWANDKKLLELYRKRCHMEVEEMTCAAQLAEILIDCANDKETFLDAGCGGGYYFLSFKQRNFVPDYYGIDYTPEMLALAQKEIGKRFLSESNFRLLAIEDLEYQFDNIICFHVLTNSPNYLYQLERLLSCTKRRIILRENIGNNPSIIVHYSPDQYIDEDKRHIHVYHNRIPFVEIKTFIEFRGFKVTEFTDKRVKGGYETVCDVPHYWRIILAERI